MELLIITGMSGAGKSQAANTLEDLGWYCIDNMPAALIPKFAELYSASPGKQSSVAFIVDVRGEVEFDTLFAELDVLRSQGFSCRTVYLDCADEVIISRYKFTRRTHPFVAAHNMSVAEALRAEREMRSLASARADYRIDTTKLSPVQLKEKICGIVNVGANAGMLVTCMSFGFKNGVPTDLDLLFDVRCFHNPFYIPELKPLTGLDAPVREYVLSFAETKKFVDKLFDMIAHLLPLYRAEGKNQLTIGIGCTGGQHRSVAISQALFEYLQTLPIVQQECTVNVVHRDVGGKR